MQRKGQQHVRVWAPSAASLDLLVEARQCAMRREDGGWWCSTCELPAGTDYSFSIDQRNGLPDPRSSWQPYGVHGPSRTVDHSAFLWTDRNWRAKPLARAIVYEMHIGTFTREGTFEAAIGKLDHLVELGVTHIQLMPVGEFSGAWGWGYDGVDLFAPHHCYGEPETLKRLMNTCHEHGVAVLLDVVYNHFGPSGNYLGQFGPYTWEGHHTPWGAAVNLDGPDSYEVRRFLCDNALMWLRDYHFDGLRLDSIHALIDTSPRHFLEQLSAEVEALDRQIGRPLVLIAESDLNDTRVIRSRDAGGYGFDAQWSDDFHHALHSLLTGETGGYYVDFGGFAKLRKAIENAFVYDGAYSEFRGRPHGTSTAGVPAHRFLAYSQTHDQVGNRAAGDRTSHLVSPMRLKIAAALTLLSPQVPMLFQGEEWAASTPFQYFTNHQDEWLARVVSEGRRSEFRAFDWLPEDVPDPQDPETFKRSKLEWEEVRTGLHAEILDWYGYLAGLRQVISPGEPAVVTYNEGRRWMRVERGPVAFQFTLEPDTFEFTSLPRS